MSISGMKSRIIGSSYRNMVKPVLFMFDPEAMHNTFLRVGKVLGSNAVTKKLTSMAFNYQNPSLRQKLLGINFRNPIGLAAGFDKNGEMISIMEDVGFGFVEIGSITAKANPGNSGKRLARLVERNSLWVHFGLNNKGADRIFERLKNKRYSIPVGVSVAKTNCKETSDSKIGLEDYKYTIKKFKDYANFIVLNISCPNSYGGRDFSSPDLFSKLAKEAKAITNKPIFVKLSPDLSKKDIDRIINISKKYHLSGFICTNLSKKHEFSKGGLSGKAVEEKSNEILEYVYRRTNWNKSKNSNKYKNDKHKFIIIGVGGVFNAEDAYKKIKLGANLVQLITGMIYQGPSLIGEINHDLVELMKKEGYNNIDDVVGSGVK